MSKRPPIQPLNRSKVPEHGTGAMINRRYRVAHKLGSGAMGQVYLVHDTQRNDQTLALKYLTADSPSALARFKMEFATLAHLRHPNISAVYDLETDVDTGAHFFTTEYIVGMTFEKAVREMRMPDILESFVQILRALAYLHGNGILHFDIKAANVLVQHDPDQGYCTKLIDFGVAAREFGGKRKGTPSYMAPEVVDMQEADHRADLYSLGVLLYSVLTQRNPFRGKTRDETYTRQRTLLPPPPSQQNAAVPPFLDTIILRMLAKDPAERLPSADEVIRTMNLLGSTQYAVETSNTRGSYIPDEGPFVGRRGERLQLRSQLQERNLSPIAWIRGDSGTGKSRLLHEAKLLAQLCGYQTLHYDFQHAAERAACLQHMRPLSSDTQQDVWIGLDNVDQLLISPGAGALFDQLQAACHDALHRHAAPHTDAPRLVIAWTTADDSQLASALCSKLGIRPEAAWQCALRNFSPDELTQYMRVCTGIEQPPAQFMQDMHRYTGGNPFFVTEMIKSLIRDGQLLDHAGRWRASTIEDLGIDLQRFAVPKSIEAAIAHDYAVLSETAQQLAAIIAVHQSPMSIRLLRDILGHPVKHDALAELMRRGFIRHDVDGGGYTYRSHAQARAMYQQLGRRARESWHDRIAEQLHNHPDASPEDLLRHEASGSDVGTAQKARWQLGMMYHESHRSSDAIPYLLRYLQVYQHMPLNPHLPALPEAHWLLGRCYHDSRDFEHAISTYAQGLRCVSDSETDTAWHGRLLEAWGLTARDQRDYQTAEAKFGEALSLLDPSDPDRVRHIKLQNALAQAILYQSHDAQAIRRARLIFERTARAAEALPLHEHRQVANNDLGHALFQQGKFQAAIPVLQSDIMFFAHTQRPRAECRARGLLAEAYRHCQRFIEAETECLKAVVLAKRSHDSAQLVHLYTNLGNVFSDQHDADQARNYYQRALDLSRRVGDPSSAMALLLNLGIICREQKDHSHAERYFTSVVAFADNGHLTGGLDERYRCRAHLELAHLHHLQKQYDTALAHITTARDVAQRSPACQSLMFWIVATTIEIHRDQGDARHARGLVPLMTELATTDVLNATAESLEASLVEDTIDGH